VAGAAAVCSGRAGRCSPLRAGVRPAPPPARRARALGRARALRRGLALLVLPLVSPLDGGDERLLSAHMLQHVLIGDAAVALLVVAVRGPLVFFLLPPAAAAAARRVPAAARAAVAAALPLVTLGSGRGDLVWHVPRFYDYAAAHRSVHDLEH
jgi:cytochrome c oxidase assembly factor CtaG